MEPKQTLRQKQVARAELLTLEADTALVRELERFPLAYDWQRRIVEAVTERVDLRRRALLPSQRQQAERLLNRLRDGAVPLPPAIED